MILYSAHPNDAEHLSAKALFTNKVSLTGAGGYDFKNFLDDTNQPITSGDSVVQPGLRTSVVGGMGRQLPGNHE